MIYVINIISPTKEGEYQEVALNKFPIIWYTDQEEIKDLCDEENFINAVKNNIKTKKIYDNASIYYRKFTDDIDLLEEDNFNVKDKIKLEYK